MLKQAPKTTRIARNLRKQESWAERLMWSWLRDHRFADYKFRRQHPIGPHVLDFFCSEAKLDIEVDGFQHGTPDHLAADAERDAFLALRGIKVLRFWNSRLRKDKQTIRDTIWRTLQERAPRRMPDYCRPGFGGRKRHAEAMRNYSRLSLTPALSRWEREHRSQSYEKSSGGTCRTVIRKAEHERLRFPSTPSGRGIKGEGERSDNPGSFDSAK